jgi:GAF domain-containing protein
MESDVVHFNVPDLEGLSTIEREFAVATADGTEEERLATLSALLRRVREVFQMDVVFVSEFVGGRRVFRHVDARPGHELVKAGASDPLEESFCQQVVDGRLPQVITDVRAHPKASRMKLPPDMRIGGHLSVPIVLATGQVFGTLCCFSEAAKPALQQRDAQALQSIAKLVAASIEKQPQD